MKTILLQGSGWRIKLDIAGLGDASLESNLHDYNRDDEEMTAALNTLESLVLAQAAAGINLDTSEFVNAFTVALNKVTEQYG
jgi:hypothetical protein